MIYVMVFNGCNSITISSFEQVARFLPEDGAVCVETCRRNLINNDRYIEMYVCIYLVD